MVGNMRGVKAAYTARAKASMGVWFRHRSWLTCCLVHMANRLHHLYAAAHAAFIYGSGVWKLSTDLWRQRMVLESRCSRAMIPCAYTNLASMGRPPTRSARKQSCALGFPSLWKRVCRQVHEWGGHLGRQ